MGFRYQTKIKKDMETNNEEKTKDKKPLPRSILNTSSFDCVHNKNEFVVCLISWQLRFHYTDGQGLLTFRLSMSVKVHLPVAKYAS